MSFTSRDRSSGPVDVVLDLNTTDKVAQEKKSMRYLPYRYDVAGVVTIGSQVPLRELEYFRAPWLGSGYDLEIRLGEVGAGLRKRTLLHRTAAMTVSYQEHLGRLGANFRVEMGSPIKVTVGPLLAKSPHVLYTNVVEALLRFLTVSRGRMLLHSACLELDGRGILLSARTDTGKTGTILRLLREQRARFLSDDMTILAPNGVASSFPKPLTISHHTLRAVQADDLTPAQWRRLRLQSRLHSKEGRAFGVRLAEMNLPIMSINAITQLLVPPPKYQVDHLVPCEIGTSVPVENLFIIERGAPALSSIALDEALEELIENTDDAYGFPPFRYFAPTLVIGDDDYERLRRRERELLYTALRRMRLNRLASDSFGWADEIPGLVRRSAPRPERAREVIVLPDVATQIAQVEARAEALEPSATVVTPSHGGNGNGLKHVTTHPAKPRLPLLEPYPVEPVLDLDAVAASNGHTVNGHSSNGHVPAGGHEG